MPKSFDQWLADQAKPAPEPELPDGVYERLGVLAAECRSCGNAYDLPVPPEEFDPAMSYCGGSPRCLP